MTLAELVAELVDRIELSGIMRTGTVVMTRSEALEILEELTRLLDLER